ncbi:MAG: hypothetical protein OEQ81_04495 [Flavobacteriaceae bacterium]|nr:hypothetical protein [Flavobacteriaceae bacterium]
MRTVWLFLGVIFLVGCGSKKEPIDLDMLNGYWEIEKVSFPDSSVKTYDISTTIDFFTFGDGKGFRKKVKPTLDGIYTTSNDAIPFIKVEEEGGVYLRYSNESESWEEEVQLLQANLLRLRNAEGIQYTYSRYEPIAITDE